MSVEIGWKIKAAIGGAVSGVLPFSRTREGQSRTVVRGQDAGGCCDLWQHASPPPSAPAVIGHAMSGQTATMLRSIKAIMHATAVFIIEVDVSAGNPLANRFIRLEPF